MKIAIEGCAHGELDKIYDCLIALQEREGIHIDLLICCGDFQSVRNNNDLRCMAVPEKYQNICTFYKYYSGEKTAPVLTIFIGGNHEASNYLQELPYGGWVAPRIYYLGRAGVVQFGNLRIGGLSGIFKGRDYLQGLWESPPYNPNSLRSVYHVRAIDVFRLKQLKEKVHVMLSHDWPRGITNYGNKEQLLKRKPFLRDDVESNKLGSFPAEDLLHKLKPDYWFAAHLHCQFAAVVEHEGDEKNSATKFLALDKCLPHRRHLQILDVTEFDGDKVLKYDAEWLAILKNTNHLLTVRNVDCHLPGPGSRERYDFAPSDEEKLDVVQELGGNLIISEERFVKTAPVYTPDSPRGIPQEPISNPQTVWFCESLGIDDPLQVVVSRSGRTLKSVIADNSSLEQTPTEVYTPLKSTRLSLPAPSTPLSEDNTIPNNETASVSNSTYVSDSITDISDCLTPAKELTKKSFKRRNQSMYTPGADSESGVVELTPSSLLNDPETPKSSKIAYRSSQEIFLGDSSDFS